MKNIDTINEYADLYINDIVRCLLPDIEHAAGEYTYTWSSTGAPMTVVLNKRSGEWRTAEEHDDYCFDTEGYFNIADMIETANTEHWDSADLERKVADYIRCAIYGTTETEWERSYNAFADTCSAACQQLDAEGTTMDESELAHIKSLVVASTHQARLVETAERQYRRALAGKNAIKTATWGKRVQAAQSANTMACVKLELAVR